MTGFVIPEPPPEIAAQAAEADLIAKSVACCAESFYQAHLTVTAILAERGYTHREAQDHSAWRLSLLWGDTPWTEPLVAQRAHRQERIRAVMACRLVRK